MADNPVYRTKAWRDASRACLARDGFRCQIALPGCRGRATTADHVIELQDGGPAFALDNLQAACRSCNTAKRNRRVAQRAKAVRQW